MNVKTLVLAATITVCGHVFAQSSKELREIFGYTTPVKNFFWDSKAVFFETFYKRDKDRCGEGFFSRYITGKTIQRACYLFNSGNAGTAYQVSFIDSRLSYEGYSLTGTSVVSQSSLVTYWSKLKNRYVIIYKDDPYDGLFIYAALIK